MTVIPQPSFIAKMIKGTFNYFSSSPISIEEDRDGNFTFTQNGKKLFSAWISVILNCTNITINSEDADPDDIMKVVNVLEEKFHKSVDINIY